MKVITIIKLMFLDEKISDQQIMFTQLTLKHAEFIPVLQLSLLTYSQYFFPCKEKWAGTLYREQHCSSDCRVRVSPRA